MLPIEEWKKRIVLFFVARSAWGNSYKATSKDEVFESFGYLVIATIGSIPLGIAIFVVGFRSRKND